MFHTTATTNIYSLLVFLFYFISRILIISAFSSSSTIRFHRTVHVKCLGAARRISSTTVDDLALKIGLNVVPKKKKTKNDEIRKRRQYHDVTVPTIIWGTKVRDFFWEKEEERKRIRYFDSYHSLPRRRRRRRSADEAKKRKVKVEWIENDQNFPLYEIHDVLSQESLDWVLSSLLLDNNDSHKMNNDVLNIYNAEELEQHERTKDKRIKTIRRSLVSRIDISNNNSSEKGNNDNNKDDNMTADLINLIRSGIPSELVEGIDNDKSHNNNEEMYFRHHPYEDGSVVYYRNTNHDFYDIHHDSYDPKDKYPLRKKHRAYTILLYLRIPRIGEDGGTEFSRLTTNNATKSSNNDDDKPLILKPKVGNAIVWPNFDINGKPYMDSIHKALPINNVISSTIRNNHRNRNKVHDDDEDNDTTISKVVINLWFEGRMHLKNDAKS